MRLAWLEPEASVKVLFASSRALSLRLALVAALALPWTPFARAESKAAKAGRPRKPCVPAFTFQTGKSETKGSFVSPGQTDIASLCIRDGTLVIRIKFGGSSNGCPDEIETFKGEDVETNFERFGDVYHANAIVVSFDTIPLGPRRKAIRDERQQKLRPRANPDEKAAMTGNASLQIPPEGFSLGTDGPGAIYYCESGTWHTTQRHLGWD
jgi:hypothetical protein